MAHASTPIVRDAVQYPALDLRMGGPRHAVDLQPGTITPKVDYASSTWMAPSNAASSLSLPPPPV
jgi:hypothetical protein